MREESKIGVWVGVWQVAGRGRTAHREHSACVGGGRRRQGGGREEA